jgi:hypothetical protein
MPAALQRPETFRPGPSGFIAKCRYIPEARAMGIKGYRDAFGIGRFPCNPDRDSIINHDSISAWDCPMKLIRRQVCDLQAPLLRLLRLHKSHRRPTRHQALIAVFMWRSPKKTAHAEVKRGISLSHLLGGAMALCITSPLADISASAAFLAATFAAHAQDTEVRVVPHKKRVTHDLRSHHRKRAARPPSDSGNLSGILPQLPDHFRNCERPAPRLCNDNY